LLSRTGRADEAEGPLREAVKTYQGLADDLPGVPAYQTGLAKALYNLGVFLAQGDRYREAEETYGRALVIQEKLLAAEPRNPTYRAAVVFTCNNLAALLAWQQKPPYRGASRAVELAQRAVELEPTNGSRWRVLSMAQFRVGNWRKCLAALGRARELRSEHGTDHFFQATAYWHLGEQAKARDHYRAGTRWLDTQAAPNERTLRLRDEAAEVLGIKAEEKRGQAPPPRAGPR
jgi:tetratricopeptide (TPR) repeat protein